MWIFGYVALSAIAAKLGMAVKFCVTKQTIHLIAENHIEERNMRVCGCEISAREVRLAVVYLNDEGNVEMLLRPATLPRLLHQQMRGDDGLHRRRVRNSSGFGGGHLARGREADKWRR